jgi:osmotically-inducible protein OsmY
LSVVIRKLQRDWEDGMGERHTTERAAAEAAGKDTATGDSQLHQRIATQLKSLGQASIDIEVRDGFVMLRGNVRTFRQKERLHRFVMGLSGVRALKDLLRVDPVETVADREVALHIRHALDAHSELPPGTAQVHVSSGVATLRGHVRSAEERFMAENVTSHCRGVTRVVNELNVDPLEEITDEATARAIRGALAYCEDFETDGVTVSVCDGTVVLRGEVPTLLDRTLAEELARMQGGVRSVDNHITVKSQDEKVNSKSSVKRKT